MKKIISFILLTAIVVSVLSGCGNLSAGSKDGSNIDSQTEETSESEAVNDSSPAESSAENSTGSSLSFIHVPKITKEEAQDKANELKAECEKRLAENGISDDDYSYGYIVRELAGKIYESPDLSDDEILDAYVYDIFLYVKTIRIANKFLDKHFDLPEDTINDTNIVSKISKICSVFPDLQDEKYIEMMEYPIKNYPDLSYGFDCFFPMQEAQIAGVDFDSTKRITTDDIISICDSAKKIKDFDERAEYVKQELLEKQAYPDYILRNSVYQLYFFDHSNDINDEQNTRILFQFYKHPYSYYDFNSAEILYTTTDENGNEIREKFRTTAEY